MVSFLASAAALEHRLQLCDVRPPLEEPADKSLGALQPRNCALRTEVGRLVVLQSVTACCYFSVYFSVVPPSEVRPHYCG